jgi:hypothetical protein
VVGSLVTSIRTEAMGSLVKTGFMRGELCYGPSIGCSKVIKWSPHESLLVAFIRKKLKDIYAHPLRSSDALCHLETMPIRKPSLSIGPGPWTFRNMNQNKPLFFKSYHLWYCAISNKNRLSQERWQTPLTKAKQKAEIGVLKSKAGLRQNQETVPEK